MILFSKIMFAKEMKDTQITGLCTFCPIMCKIANYAQTYVCT